MPAVPERPWEDLPPEVAALLRPELPALADEIIAAISQGVPVYRRPLEGGFGAGLRIGVEEALRQFLALIERRGAERGAGREVYVNLGRGEMRAGRGIDALQAAYRLGARVAWRRLARAGERAALEPHVMYTLAEAIFAYIDELSAESVEGYAREQAEAAGRLQRRRRALAGLLIQAPPADPAAVEEAAAAAGWRLPKRLAAVAHNVPAERLAGRTADDWLAAPAPEAGCLIVPDPQAPRRWAQLRAALDGETAAIGPAVAWHDAHLSYARARDTLRLLEEGALDGGAGLVSADEHAVELVLHSDRRLARDLARRALAPLDGLTPAARGRYLETLRAWLDTQGRAEAAAARLHVHPQTVRYRMARLRELLGEALDDPAGRFELELALRLDGGAPAQRRVS